MYKKHDVFTHKNPTWTTGQAKAGALGVDLGRRGDGLWWSVKRWWKDDEKMIYGADMGRYF